MTAVPEISQPKIGDKGKDIITGVQGIITCRAVYLHRDTQFLLEFVKDGEPKEAWFPVGRVMRID